ncbi:hypothetical protein SeMB42_g03935 [Synchytrium endobioticum]|uniref:Uncharacterized protein n=1 Tax=Synchytrium endobioticum TaxID=286115 RepID=A0A507CKN8_9FUNG|nr:hypothetical protein SeLEV6574_g06753 [Synchytrium endobioticum]TPX45640.1 hypothetical protein SeMB42_g03935 [Synchytrium endobioticum]
MALTLDSPPIGSERNVDWSSNRNAARVHVRVERWAPSYTAPAHPAQQACIESKRVQEERAKRHRHLLDFQKALMSRLQVHAKRKKEALSDALDQVAVQATQRHKRCSHLFRCNRYPHHHSACRCVSPSPSPVHAAPNRPFPVLATSLSSESLDLQDLPNDRSYFVHHSDRYHYFHNKAHPESTASVAAEWDLKEEDESGKSERELRLFYRQSHLDEIRRKQFGAVYQATRHKYSQQGRHEASEWRSRAKMPSTSVSPEPGSLRLKAGNRPVFGSLDREPMEYRAERCVDYSLASVNAQ